MYTVIDLVSEIWLYQFQCYLTSGWSNLCRYRQTALWNVSWSTDTDHTHTNTTRVEKYSLKIIFFMYGFYDIQYIWIFMCDTVQYCLSRLHLFDQKYSKYCEIILLFKRTVLCLNIHSNIIYSSDVKLNFLHHYSSPQCHMILQICCSRNMYHYDQSWK